MTNPTPDPDLLVADFDYVLSPELIAQLPLAERDRSRLLVLDRFSGAITHASILDLPTLLRPGDLLVANNSRVIPARLQTVRAGSGGRVELLLLHQAVDRTWTALARPARRLHAGDRLVLLGGPTPETIEIVERCPEGMVRVRFLGDADTQLEEVGTVPLPPYIRSTLDDAERYQTTYAKVPGSTAAPTAGLHVTAALRETLATAGIGWAEVTLHIGLDTFRPVTVERVEEHRIHTEWCSVSDEVARRIATTRQTGGRVIALGTTAARTLETLGCTWTEEDPRGLSGPTDIFITPGYTWRIVDGMVTNFHLPRSTLLMMVSALAGRETRAVRLPRGDRASLPFLLIWRRDADRVGLILATAASQPRVSRARMDEAISQRSGHRRVTVNGVRVLLLLVLALSMLTACGSKDDDTPGATIGVPTPNPADADIDSGCWKATDRVAGSEKQWKQAPAMVLDEAVRYTATLTTNKGAFEVEFYPDDAPVTVNNFICLARAGYYDDTPFHRIIADFVIQGGDPTGTGSGSPGYRFDDEPITRDYELGTLAMANSGPDTNGSQFFVIVGDDGRQLPKNYTIFGQVISGMDVVNQIAQTPTGPDERGEVSVPLESIVLQSVTIAESPAGDG